MPTTATPASAAAPAATAARLVEHGKPLDVTRVELPVPGEDEVVVDLLHAGVNPVDRYRAQGHADPDSPLPRTLGAEAVGTVDGAHYVVFGRGVGRTRDGVWASRAVVPRSALVEVPDGADLRQAAAMGVAGITAWRTVTELAQVTEDDRVLVLGARGGVGSAVVSLAHGLGATVWGQSGSPDRAAWLTGRGADRVVAAGPDELAEQLAELRPTVVFDPLGGEFTGAAIQAMAPRGRMVTFGTSAGPRGTVPLQHLYRSGLRVLGYGGLMDSDDTQQAALREALRALAAGTFQVHIGTELPLERVNEAFELLERRQVDGKVVLDLRG